MATSMNKISSVEKSSVGLLIIVGNVISNEQSEQLQFDLKQSIAKIDDIKYHQLNDTFNNLIHENEFQTNSQYRQISRTENGSIAAFLYLPNFHTLKNVLKEIFHECYHVCIVYSGQQVDTNGALVLSDSLFTCDNLFNLFDEYSSFLVQDLQLILPYISNQWKNLATQYSSNHLKTIEMNDLSDSIKSNHTFGKLFYDRFVHFLNRNSNNFDIYSKLTPRDSSGTIAFNEPNLYILYGQQGEASLFGVRGFVLLVNGGFSRVPSYWNLIRGLQNIDACILTHFDYDVFPGLQTIIHKKQISLSNDGQSCKPDIGTIFVNHSQRVKLQTTSESKTLSSKNRSINLHEDIEVFLNDIKKLNIGTFDLSKRHSSNKLHSEPINLYKKIAFGSLDLYVLHPNGSNSDDEKLVSTVQKIPIRNRTPLSTIIPVHHWYSSCSLLVWTPYSKSTNNNLVRILYTGACPQTLVFEALSKVEHLDILHAFEPTVQQENTQTSVASRKNSNAKNLPQEQPRKPSVSKTNGTGKILSPSATLKPKVSQTSTAKSPKVQGSSPIKKKSLSVTADSTHSIQKNKNTEKSSTISAKKRTTSVTNSSTKLTSKEKKDDKSQTIIISRKTPLTTTSESVQSTNKDETPEESHGIISTISTKFHELTDQVSRVINDHTDHITIPETNNQVTEKLEKVNIDEKEEKEISEIVINNEHANDLIEENKQDLDNNGEHRKSSENLQDSSLSDYNEIETKENYEDSVFLTGANEPTIENNQEDVLQSKDHSITTNDHQELLSQTHTISPIIEDQSNDQNIQDTVDEIVPEEKLNDDFENDEIEIIQHDAPTSSNEHLHQSNEEIHPQGLPIDKENYLQQSVIRKNSNRTDPSSSKAKSKQSTTAASSIFHIDVAYIPYNGNENYVDSEFFRRIRARYYILNAVQINSLTLESLIDGKQQWDKTEQKPVTLVPTFDGEQLREFFLIHKNRLAELNINILPAATRCNLQYDDESSPAQRLRFSSMYNTNEH